MKARLTVSKAAMCSMLAMPGVIVPASLASSPSGLALSLSDCNCDADFEAVDWNCSDTLYAVVIITPKEHGTCSDWTSFCFDADPCKWEYSMSYKSTNPSADIILHWNGSPRVRATGSLEVGPLDMQLDCGMGAVVSLTSQSSLCLEANFACRACPASND